MQKRKAFTLVEMLVVITIIGILSFMAISSYGAARNSAQLDILADLLVSSFKQQQSLAKSGKVYVVDGEEKRKCYGLYFSKNGEEDESHIQYVETIYNAVSPQGADLCDLDSRIMRGVDDELDYELNLIEKFGGDVNNLLILFKPPFGKIVIGDGFNTDPQSIAIGQLSPNIKFEFGLPNQENPRYVIFDASTGLAKRSYE